MQRIIYLKIMSVSLSRQHRETNRPIAGKWGGGGGGGGGGTICFLAEARCVWCKLIHISSLSAWWLLMAGRICARVVMIETTSLQWRHNERDGVSNHQFHHCLLDRLFRRRSMKTWKLRVTGLCAVNSPMTGEFSAQMASNTENISIWWRHDAIA